MNISVSISINQNLPITDTGLYETDHPRVAVLVIIYKGNVSGPSGPFVASSCGGFIIIDVYRRLTK